MRINAFRFEHDLVAIFIPKLNDLILKGGAIPRADSFDLTAVKRGPIHVAADDPVNLFVCVCDVAADFVFEKTGGPKRKRCGFGISRLWLEFCKVDGSAIQSRRRPGLQPAPIETKCAN